MFETNYLELIYITSEIKAAQNLLRLDLRSNRRTTGASPFGICIRGKLSTSESENFWEYSPPYFPNGKILIHNLNESDPTFPLIFLMPGFLKPKSRNDIDSSMLKNKLGVTRIKYIEIGSPRSLWPLTEQSNEIHLFKSNKPKLKIILDGNTAMNILLNELLEVSILPD